MLFHRIILSSLLLFEISAVFGQSNIRFLNRVWELEQIEPLKVTMGSIGQEFTEVDLRHDSLIVFRGGDQRDSVAYKVINDELAIFDRHGIQLGPEVIWKIEQLTAYRFVLMFFDTVGKVELVRLTYRAK
jgi:hypothetical protein